MKVSSGYDALFVEIVKLISIKPISVSITLVSTIVSDVTRVGGCL